MLKLFRYLRPYKKYVIVCFIFLFLQTMGTIAVPALTAEIINIGIADKDISYIVKIGILMLAVIFAGGCSAGAAVYLSSKTASLFAKDIRIQVFKKSQSFSSSDFEDIGTSSMITRSTEDVMQIQQAVLMTLQFIIPAPLMAAAGLVLAYTRNSRLSLLLVAVMILFIFYAIFIGRKMVPLTRKMQGKMDHINRTLLENLSGVRVIRAFNKTLFQQEKFNKTAADYAETAIKLNRVFAVAVPLVALIMNLTIVLILWLGGNQVNIGKLAIGDVVAFVEYAVLILLSLNMGVMTVIYLFRAQASAVRINEVLEHKFEITEGGRKIVTGDGSSLVLKFNNVTFSYPNAEEPVLDKISFETKAGEVTAIIGATGSGKTTLVNLVPRFHEIQSGSILINDTDIREVSQKELREKIGIVPQKAFLFSGTIEENIKYGKKNASREEIQEAAITAQAHEFISKLPDGYQSIVAQSGDNFSGGQKQRIAIARALVKRAEVYILDDSFSALDFQTDAKLRAALKKQILNSIVLLVAQRISTVMKADRIIVLEEGKVAGIGTHKELMKTCEVYQQIALSQLSKAEMETQ